MCCFQVNFPLSLSLDVSVHLEQPYSSLLPYSMTSLLMEVMYIALSPALKRGQVKLMTGVLWIKLWGHGVHHHTVGCMLHLMCIVSTNSNSLSSLAMEGCSRISSLQ